MGNTRPSDVSLSYNNNKSSPPQEYSSAMRCPLQAEILMHAGIPFQKDGESSGYLSLVLCTPSSHHRYSKSCDNCWICKFAKA